MEGQYNNIANTTPIELNGNNLTINDLHRIAFEGTIVKLYIEANMI